MCAVCTMLLQLCLTLCDPVDCSPLLSIGFSRQEYWSGLLCPSPGDLSNSGIELTSLISPALAGRFFTTSATWDLIEELQELKLGMEAPGPVDSTFAFKFHSS